MALAERISLRDATPRRDGDVILGDDFVAPDAIGQGELRHRRERRGLFSLKDSPLTRKIITFNLVALNILVAGILLMNSSREPLAVQRINSLLGEAELIASVFEVQAATGLAGDVGANAASTINALDLRSGLEVFVFDPAGTLLSQGTGAGILQSGGKVREEPTIIVDFLSWLWSGVAGLTPFGEDKPGLTHEQLARAQVELALANGTTFSTAQDVSGTTTFTVASPVIKDGKPFGAVALVNAGGEIDTLVRVERERVLQMFLIATLVSIGLSIVLASTIANPISDLAAAAEIGRDRDRRKAANGRIRIPDMTARPDEIGRLSGALRGMVSALYDRIDGNEQFAADVAHEIKNPLASLRSAVGTLRVAKRDDQREKLLDVIEHDVRRLDRLVSDISNASRLDSELVKEEQEPFDLLKMLGNLGDYLGQEARSQGIDFITDLPDEPIVVHGLEARLAQVFVNLITNAISFCEDGDAIRVWARQRENRVLVVVEDTGPGIPEEALTKVFKRFYSERPAGQFGNNSGLGLAISKQIVEAHDGVIWAENIRPTDADPTSEPLGARFVVGLPV
ncbi:ATP-binding protein [Seohaeicola saemankumensis]|uniref:histidine kinase n=1 Tax=Seohaeicola saemankumensis TaxID=481181 RepID=A0ABW3TF70_9RHOB